MYVYTPPQASYPPPSHGGGWEHGTRDHIYIFIYCIYLYIHTSLFQNLIASMSPVRSGASLWVRHRVQGKGLRTEESYGPVIYLSPAKQKPDIYCNFEGHRTHTRPPLEQVLRVLCPCAKWVLIVKDEEHRSYIYCSAAYNLILVVSISGVTSEHFHRQLPFKLLKFQPRWIYHWPFKGFRPCLPMVLCTLKKLGLRLSGW